MSLDVSPALLEKAERGEVSDAEFVACVRESLPYAWNVITGVIAEADGAGDGALPSPGAFRSGDTPLDPHVREGVILSELTNDSAPCVVPWYATWRLMTLVLSGLPVSL